MQEVVFTMELVNLASTIDGSPRRVPSDDADNGGVSPPLTVEAGNGTVLTRRIKGFR